MLPLLSNAANSAQESLGAIDTPLEYYFGALALVAIVMTWLWLWLRTRDSIRKLAEVRQLAAELEAEKPPEPEAKP